ncbi:MAG: alpha/beta fold hydrolase, partial [Candidatus Nanohaloarchaea archaeon]
ANRLIAMDFSLQRIGDSSLHYFESGSDSRVQLLFLPGGMNPGLWKHQLKYFSRVFRVASFQPTVSYRDFESEVAAAEDVLDQDSMTDVVLISHTAGNATLKELEPREEVVATVRTGCIGEMKIPPRMVYNALWKLGCRKPKIVKKLFFSGLADYRVIRNFSSDLEKPDYADFKTFLEELDDSKPVKNALVVHAESDRFSSREKARSLGSNTSISVLQDAGTFSFYEKPQEYNKALHDFLTKLEEFVEKRETFRAREKNRSLKEFSKERLEVKR